MNGSETLLEGLQWAHTLLRMVTSDMTAEQAHWMPPGIANPAGAQYVHAVCSEDAIIQLFIKGEAPLFESDWAGRTGASSPQMRATAEWVRVVRIDIPAFHTYARAVADSAEALVAGLSEEDLTRVLDLATEGLGQRTLRWVINALIIGHLNNMAGEISCLKGLQGAKGYPF